MEKELLKKLDQLVSSGHTICTDSRLAESGAIFFALKGPSFNGNKFALQALEKGCIAAVVDEKITPQDERIFETIDVQDTLQQLSLFHRKQFHIPVLGITGSNGKTTTKELVHAVLATTFHTLATKGNLNNHIGVPLTLLDLNQAHEIAIIEMGANHMGEIGELSALALPDYGIITNIGKAHLEGFGSLENIVKTKTELYRSVMSRNGTLFINGDNPGLMKEAGDAVKVLYGRSPEQHCSGMITEESPFLSVAFQANKALGKTAEGISGTIHTRLVGAYNFENIMAAIAIGLFFGVSPENIIRAIEGYVPSNSRSQWIDNGRNVILLDAYNANPTSMAAALENFSGFGKTPKAVILGDMLELGDVSQQEHSHIIRTLEAMNFERIILVGPEFKAIAKPSDHQLVFSNVSEACLWLSNNQLRGYHILVKGSRGIQMEKVLEAL
ncbi:MAG: UDP-N-acetylmuramoyl-tripeptide--D-alanyl-D-alanine ligase [Bacteroides sp.]|jgi:UDP-N-acetylmuramoyl-tripeptide--D-alanyl-D-alanine ligase|nr:UDP-N-acetylmuramoyl-tripeptide--D-alanyl-D-alanine ligase [Bacteroides sp.]